MINTFTRLGASFLACFAVGLMVLPGFSAPESTRIASGNNCDANTLNDFDWNTSSYVYLSFLFGATQDGGDAQNCPPLQACTWSVTVNYEILDNQVAKICLVPIGGANCPYSSALCKNVTGITGSFTFNFNNPGLDCGEICEFVIEARKSDDTVLDSLNGIKLHCANCI